MLNTDNDNHIVYLHIAVFKGARSEIFKLNPRMGFQVPLETKLIVILISS